MQLQVEEGYIRIFFDKVITQTNKAYLLNCEGDEVWVAKNHCKLDRQCMTVDIEEWLYNILFDI